MKSTFDYFCDHALMHITAKLDFAMRQKNGATHWISTTGLTVYQKTAEMRFAVRDDY